jgi:hypothetical protein
VILESLAEAFAVGAVGDALPWRVDVVLVVRDLDVGEERAFVAEGRVVGKELKLTSVENIGRSQLIPSVRPTNREVGRW